MDTILNWFGERGNEEMKNPSRLSNIKRLESTLRGPVVNMSISNVATGVCFDL